MSGNSVVTDGPNIRIKYILVTSPPYWPECPDVRRRAVGRTFRAPITIETFLINVRNSEHFVRNDRDRPSTRPIMRIATVYIFRAQGFRVILLSSPFTSVRKLSGGQKSRSYDIYIYILYTVTVYYNTYIYFYPENVV